MKITQLSTIVFLFTMIVAFSQTILTIDGKTFQKESDQSLVVCSETENGDIQFQPLARADSIVTAIFSFKSPPLVQLKAGETSLYYHEHEQFEQSVSRRSNTSIQAANNSSTEILHHYYVAFNGVAVKGRLDHIRQLAKLPMVAGYSLERTFQSTLTSSIKQIQADRAQNELGYDGSGVLIGVIDTGIDYTHTALGSGFGPGYRVSGGYDFVNNDADPMDDNGHGTHVAGIIGSNDSELMGVAPGIDMLTIKVLDENGIGTESVLLAAIEYGLDPDSNPATDDGVDVVNISLGGPPIANDPVVQAVENATRAGVLCVVAAGNSGEDNTGFETVGSPAVAASSIAVGSNNENYELSSFSSKGPTAFTFLIKPDILAPGENIKSTWLNHSYMEASGTSMAAPHGAGTAALLKQQHPQWDPAQLKAALVNSGDHIKANASPYAVGNGCVNAWTACTRPFSVQPGLLSFAPVDLKTSVWCDTLELTVNNYDTIERYFQFDVRTPNNGIHIELSPSNLSLAPKSQQSIGVFLTVLSDVSIVKEHPFAYSGNILCVSEHDTVRTPFGVIKSNLLAIDFDYEPSFYTIYSPELNYYEIFESSPGITSYAHRLPDGEYNILAYFEDTIITTDSTQFAFLVEKPIQTGGFQKVFISRNDAKWPAYASQQSVSSVAQNDSLIYQSFWVSLTRPLCPDFLNMWIDQYPLSQPPRLFVSKLGEHIRLESNVTTSPKSDPLLLNPYTIGIEREEDVQLDIPTDDYERFFLHIDPVNPNAQYKGFSAAFASSVYKRIESPISGRWIHTYSIGGPLGKSKPTSIRLQKSAAEMDSSFFRYFELGSFDTAKDPLTHYDWRGKFRTQSGGQLLCFDNPHHRPFATHLIKNFSADPGDTLVFSRWKNALVPVFFVNGAFTEHGTAMYINNKRNRGIVDFPGVVNTNGYFSRHASDEMYTSSFIRSGEEQNSWKSDLGDTYYPADESSRHRLLGSTTPVTLSGQQSVTTFDFNCGFTSCIPCVDLFQVQSNGKPTEFVQKGQHNIIRFIPWDWANDITDVTLALMASNGNRINLAHQKNGREYQAVIPNTLPHEYIDVIASVTDANGSRMEILVRSPAFILVSEKVNARIMVACLSILTIC